MDGTIDRPSDTNMSFKHYLPSLCSLVVAVADPSGNAVWMPVEIMASIQHLSKDQPFNWHPYSIYRRISHSYHARESNCCFFGAAPGLFLRLADSRK